MGGKHGVSAVEVVEFNGRKFRRYPESPRRELRVYFSRVDNGKQSSLHRAVWEHHHGPIPPDHHVHHKDENPLNNDIANLECLPRAEHLRLHWDDAKREWARENVKRAIAAAPEWHRSEEGRAWHAQHGREAWATRKPEERACDQCGSAFECITLRLGDRFCSNNCKSKWRRASGIDNVERPCAKCGATFTVNKYSKQIACSRSCGTSFGWSRSKHRVAT